MTVGSPIGATASSPGVGSFEPSHRVLTGDYETDLSPNVVRIRIDDLVYPRIASHVVDGTLRFSPGPASPITIRFALSQQDPSDDLRGWFRTVTEGGDPRRDITIALHSGSGPEAVSYQFHDCLPVAYASSVLNLEAAGVRAGLDVRCTSVDIVSRTPGLTDWPHDQQVGGAYERMVSVTPVSRLGHDGDVVTYTGAFVLRYQFPVLALGGQDSAWETIVIQPNGTADPFP